MTDIYKQMIATLIFGLGAFACGRWLQYKEKMRRDNFSRKYAEQWFLHLPVFEKHWADFPPRVRQQVVEILIKHEAELRKASGENR